jgi:hypothetical protein
MMYFFFSHTSSYLDLETAVTPTQQAVRSPNSAPDEEKNKDNVRILSAGTAPPLACVVVLGEVRDRPLVLVADGDGLERRCESQHPVLYHPDEQGRTGTMTLLFHN